MFKICPISEEGGRQGVWTRWWNLELPKTDFHMPHSYRICRRAGGRCWKAGRDFCPCPSSLFSPSLSCDSLSSEALPFQPVERPSPSSPIPRLPRARSCGRSPDTQPRWVCPDSSAPAASRGIRPSSPSPTFVCQLHHLKNKEGILACVYVNDRIKKFPPLTHIPKYFSLDIFQSA